jgi:hypothetical protein
MTTSGDPDDDDDVNFTGDLYGAPFVDGLPVTTRDQSCFCGAAPTAVSRIASESREFQVAGKGYTLPSFITLCDTCEELRDRGDAAELTARRLDAGSDGSWETEISKASARALVRAQLSDRRPLRQA